MGSILQDFYSREVGGNFGSLGMVEKVLQLGFYWPTLFKDAFNFVTMCDTVKEWGTYPRSMKFSETIS